jgi:hypothetical protein
MVRDMAEEKGLYEKDVNRAYQKDKASINNKISQYNDRIESLKKHPYYKEAWLENESKQLASTAVNKEGLNDYGENIEQLKKDNNVDFEQVDKDIVALKERAKDKKFLEDAKKKRIANDAKREANVNTLINRIAEIEKFIDLKENKPYTFRLGDDRKEIIPGHYGYDYSFYINNADTKKKRLICLRLQQIL